MIMEQNEEPAALQAKILSSMYRTRVIDAYRNRKIFTVFGNYDTIRRALLKRGWLEKLPPSRYSKLQKLPEEVLLQHSKRGNEYEAVAISKMINNLPAFFVWQSRGHRDIYADVQPYRNRIRRSQLLDFSTKVGLIGCAEQQQWYAQEGMSGMLYPRFFRLGGNQEEQLAFIEEFRMTQCRSFLNYLIKYTDSPEIVIDSEKGSILPDQVHFAISRIRRQIDEWENTVSLDTSQTEVSEAEWTAFLSNSNKLVNLAHKLKCSRRQYEEFIRIARNILSTIRGKRPDYLWDGYKNLWILKPGYQSRGLGIIIRNDLDDILKWAATHSNRRYIVQKYIEQPLLIYRTKFDIRQYMLVFIRKSTVQIWLYTDCYLRFSSQEYSLDDLRDIIHLTNNSIQKKYQDKAIRDPRLPKNNMWSLDQFKTYMKTKNLSDDIWDGKIFAGFRENLIAVVMASLNETNICENCFELYGCDFMLDEQYNPILIEINSTPDLSASTEVTACICPNVMHDCLKVTVDLPRNNRAATGLFRMVYEASYTYKEKKEFKGIIHGKSMELRTVLKTPVRTNILKNNKNNEAITQTQRSSKKRSASNKVFESSLPCKKSKTRLSKNVQPGMKAAVKESLALRYTMVS